MILWLVPFNYIWLTQLLETRREEGNSTQQQSAVQRVGTDPIVEQGYPHYPGYQPPGLGDKRPDSQTIDVHSIFPSRPRLRYVTILLVFVTTLHWCMSLAVVALHFKYSWLDKANHPTYVVASPANVNPSTIADMPQSCLDWLQSSSTLVQSKLVDMNLIPVLFCLISAFQFIACTVVVLFSARGRYRVLQKLKTSAWASLVSLGLPALGTGIWIIAKVAFGDQDTWITYTHNSTATGGCTFAAVSMDRRWGYWDVQYSLPVRISLSVLGVA